jgi:hypothetical protein
MNGLREVLDPWLGSPGWKQNAGRVTLVYRFALEDNPPIPLKLKVEINSREHFSAYGFKRQPFAMNSRWFDGASDIQTYALDELLGTKLRALYQRKQGRDLFDLATALKSGLGRPDRIIESFAKYMDHGGLKVTRAQFERNLSAKLQDPQFTGDITALLADGFRWDIEEAAPAVLSRLIALLPGDAWKGEA